MKKVIVIFTLIVSIFTFLINFNKFDTEKHNKIIDIESKIATPFFIPDDLGLGSNPHMYKIITKTAKEKNANLFRSSVTSNKYGKLEDVKYVLINNKTNFYDAFDFYNKDIKKNISGGEFYSTDNSNDSNQLGRLKDFGRNDIYSIRSFENLFNSLSVSGVYYAELPKGVSIDDFLETLCRNIKKDLNIKKYKVSDFKISEKPENHSLREPAGILNILNLMVIILSIIIITFFVLKDSKKISIYKLNGISNTKIWYELIQKHMNKTYLFISIFTVLSSMLFKLPFSFVMTLILKQIMFYFIFTVFLLIPLAFILKTNLALNIKAKENDKYLIISNIIIKILFISIIASSGVKIVLNTKTFIKDYNNVSKWEVSKDYGVLQPTLIGNDDFNDPAHLTDLTGKLYSFANKNGALFVNATRYEDNAEFEPGYNYFLTMGVNPNYLDKFSVKDMNGKDVKVSESETSYIVLAPEKYKDKDKKLIDDVIDIREGNYLYEEDFIKDKIKKEDFMKQEIKIIWIKNDQEVFSFNPEVWKNNNNMIKDPIIEVITENNSLVTERDGIWGGGGDTPLKVKLINNDTIETYNHLLPMLQEVGLDDNLPSVLNINELILAQIKELKESIIYSLTMSIILFACFLIISIQNTTIIFNKYKQKFIIKRSFGVDIFNSYKEIFNIFIISYIIQIFLLLLNGGVDHYLLASTSIIYLVDFIVILIAVAFLEKKNKIRILKGE